MTDCIFCKIIKGEIPSNKIYEDDKVFAFSDIHPQSKHHILFVPKEHCPDIDTASSEVLNNIFQAIKKTVSDLKLNKSGYRICINNGIDAGQTVFHLHVHLLGGERLSDKMA